jgi:ribosomal protein S18 acetylase RimI-like enzyme
MKIKSLANINSDALFNVFQKAFATYEMQLKKDELLEMLKRRGFTPELSFAAFDGEEMVSFTLNGIDTFNDKLTAYDTGTGTLKEYQGKGLATQVFNESIPYLKKAGVEEYLLEVLQHNVGAVSVYKKIGFQIVREFYYFRQQRTEITNTTKAIHFPYIIQPIDIHDEKQLSAFWDFKPSWQNSLESIRRSLGNFICKGIFVEDKLVGYSVFEPQSGDITQIAVDKKYRRKGLGSLLLQEILESDTTEAFKIINTDIQCDSITGFLRSKNMKPTGKQYEMTKKL